MSFFKDLIFEKEDKKEVKKPQTKFPSGENKVEQVKEFKFPTSDEIEVKSEKPIISCDPYMEEVIKKYESGLDSLNKEGYDFYEFFKGITSIPNADKNSYQMAFTMAKSMSSNLSTNSLIQDAEDYKREILKVHNSYSTQGANKVNELNRNKSLEEETLKDELTTISEQMRKLQSRKSECESKLSTIDNKYHSQVEEAKCKIEANDVAKNRIISKIDSVISGIKSYIN